jgi:hypothetical protein
MLALMLFGAGLGYGVISSGPTKDGAPALLRRSFEFNQSVSEHLVGVSRESVTLGSPGLEKEIRVNGDIGLEDDLDSDAYRIEVKWSDHVQRVALKDLLALPRTSVATLFKCVEGWSDPLQYSGVKFSDFAHKFGLGKKPDGSDYRYVGFETPDSRYYVSIDFPSLMHPQSVLAFEMDGRPLSEDNGAPVRLIIPIKYGIKSIKRIGRIVFSDERPKDYWAERGYDWFSGL